MEHLWVRRLLNTQLRHNPNRASLRNGIEIVDGLTGERLVARVRLVERLKPEDRFELVVVAMQKASRMAVCPVLAQNAHLGSTRERTREIKTLFEAADIKVR